VEHVWIGSCKGVLHLVLTLLVGAVMSSASTGMICVSLGSWNWTGTVTSRTMEESSGITCGPCGGDRLAKLSLALVGRVAGGTLRGVAGMGMPVGTLRDAAGDAGTYGGSVGE